MEENGNIIVIEPVDDFKKIHKSIIKNKNIDCITLGIYTKIVVLGAEWNLNIKGLKKYLGISENKIRNSICILEREGYVRRRVNYHDGKLDGWIYEFMPYPIAENERTKAGYSSSQCEDNIQCCAEISVTEKQPTLKTANTENGEDDNNRLNKHIDLININKEIKENTKRKKESAELYKQFEDFVLLYRKLTKKATRSVKTEFEDFKTRHKDWAEIIPYLSVAITRETKERQNAEANNKFFPLPKMLQTYLGKQRAWELYVTIGEDIEKAKNNYMPIESPMLAWNDYYNCYLYIGGFYDGKIYDGYNDEDRPDGATVMLNNARGTLRWNSQTKTWDKI